MHSKISCIEYYLPEKVLSNDDLAREFPEWNSEKITEKIGVKERHVVSDGETALDLALKASEKLFLSFDRDLVDFILFCTQSPDYFLPTTACMIQEKLKLRTNIGALDFNLGCSGYIYGLALAKGLIAGKIASNILLITAETYTKHIHPKDKGNRSIFGDAAAATIVTKTKDEHILNFELGTDGSGMNNLIVPNGGLRNKFDLKEKDIVIGNEFVRNNNYLFMNGPEILNFSISRIPKLVFNTLLLNELNLDTIDYVIFHQANKLILDYLRKKIQIPVNKFYQNMEETGNTVSASIPIALKECIENKIVKSGNKILLVGFGVGYSFGAVVIKI
jgi:3-oxoacyl-[acyl-carrier-protein] synthase III